MSNLKQNLILGWTGILFVSTGALFYYDQIILERKAANDVVPIYIANKNISQGEKIEEELFTKLIIRKDTLLPTYITNIEEVIGQTMAGGLVQSEVLTVTRISDEYAQNEGDYYLRLIPDVKATLDKDDTVIIYKRVKNEDKTISIEKLFDLKTIKEVEEDNVYYIMATEEEVKKYYLSKKDGEVIAVKQGVNPLKDIDSKLDFSEFLPKAKKEVEQLPSPYNPFEDDIDE